MTSSCHSDCRCHHGSTREDVSFVTPDLAVGGYVHRSDVPALLALGITHMLNVNWPDRPEPRSVVRCFDHLDLAILDDCAPKPAWWFMAGITFARRAVRDGGKLLVHCGHGVNRSPAMAYAILRSRGFDAKTARKTILESRPQAGTGSTGSALAVYMSSADAALDSNL